MPAHVSTLVFYEPSDLARDDGVAFEPYAPVKRPDPVVLGNLPDEQGRASLYGTVIRDPWTGKFRMWYTGTSPRYYARYAESDDGIVWTKPAVRDPRWVTHDAPNGVMPGQFPVVVCRPDADDPIDRWRLFIWDGMMNTFRSADGIRWEKHPDYWNPVWPYEAGAGLGEVPIPFWDPDRREYIAMARLWIGPHMRKVERIRDAKSGKYISHPFLMRQRMIGRGSSPDGYYWMGPDLTFACDDHDPLGSQPYQFAAWPYAGRHLGLVSIFHSFRHPDAAIAGTLRLYLAWSTDGCYEWARQPDRLREFIPLGPEGTWDCGMISQPTCPVEVGDEWWFWYGGNEARHIPGDRKRNGIGLATMPKGRLIDMHATGDAAEVETHAIEPAEGALWINADSGSGALRVAVEGDGEIPPGWSDPVRGDGVRLPVTWNGRSWKTASPSGGTPVRLRFRIEGSARLWECGWA